MKVTPLSPSRMDLPTIQTDFYTNQLTIEQSEAELRAKVSQLIEQGNLTREDISSILEEMSNKVTQKVLKEVNKLDLTDFTGSWHGVERPSLANEGISGAVSKLEEDNERITGAIGRLEEEKVNKEQGKGLSTNDYTTDEKNKLSGIEVGANAYTHPQTHPATIIAEDSSHRFTTDSEKSVWNNTFRRDSTKCDILTTKEGKRIAFQHGYIKTDGNEYWFTVTFPKAFRDEYYDVVVSPFYKSAFGSVAVSYLTPSSVKVCAQSGVLYVYWLAIGELAN